MQHGFVDAISKVGLAKFLSDLSIRMTIMSQLAFPFQICWIQFPFFPLTASMEFVEVNENLNAQKMQENG